MPDGRRWSDEELRELAALVKSELPSVYQFTNGARRRAIINWTVVGGIATLLGLLQSYLLKPIEAKIDHTEQGIAELATRVREHNESAPLLYVTREQYNLDQQNLMREIRSLRDLIIITEKQEQRR